jgi:hypothetical protein
MVKHDIDIELHNIVGITLQDRKINAKNVSGKFGKYKRIDHVCKSYLVLIQLIKPYRTNWKR